MPVIIDFFFSRNDNTNKMENNVGLLEQRNEESVIKKPPKPSNAPIHNYLCPEMSDSGSQFMSKSSIRTPSTGHRKTRSWAQSPKGKNSTPSKTRFDYTNLPANNIDVRACEAAALRYKMQKRKQETEEKKTEKGEWYKINNETKKKVNKDIVNHETFITKENTQLRRMSMDRENSRRSIERKERQDSFKELKEAREKITR